MLQPDTRHQIAALDVDRRRPLIICDVDEVVVHFLRGFEAFLAGRGMWLDPASFALNGNVRHTASGEPIDTTELGTVIHDFFEAQTATLALIEGAAEALDHLAGHAGIVMLTNLPARFADQRRANLRGHGIDFPVVTNAGPKGPAVAALAEDHAAPVVFIDDIPNYLQSVGEHLPHARLIHFMQDARFARHAPRLDNVSLRTDNWGEARRHILGLIGAPAPS